MLRSYHRHFLQLSPNVKLFLLGNTIQGMGLSVYNLLFNLYLKELGYGESVIGGLISTTSLGISLMAIPALFFIERVHVKHLVMAGMFFSSIFYFAQITQVTESSIFTFGLLASMFLALFNISVSPFYLRNSTPQIRVQLFALNSSLNMIGHFIGYLGGGYLPEFLSSVFPDFSRIEIYRSSMMLALLVVFSSNLIFTRIKRVPIPREKKKLFEGLKEKDWNTLSKLIMPKLCLAFGGGLIVPFLNLYLKEKFNFSTEMIGISYATLQLIIFAGIFITPLLIQKTTHLRFILITSMLAVPFMITMGLTGNIGIVLSSFFMRGLLMNMGSPINSCFEMEHVREKDCVFSSAVIMFCYHLAYTSSTRIGGYLIEKYSFGPTFYVAALGYAGAAFFYYRFFNQEDVAKNGELEAGEVEAESIPKAA